MMALLHRSRARNGDSIPLTRSSHVPAYLLVVAAAVRRCALSRAVWGTFQPHRPTAADHPLTPTHIPTKELYSAQLTVETSWFHLHGP